jgi:hypothetical protein
MSSRSIEGFPLRMLALALLLAAGPAEAQTPASVTVTTTVITRGPEGEQRTVETKVFPFGTPPGSAAKLPEHAAIGPKADGSGLELVDRGTGERLHPQDIRPPAPPPAVNLRRIGGRPERVLERRDLGERSFGEWTARGDRILWEMRDRARADAPFWRLSLETWKAANGILLEQSTWDSRTDRTEIHEYRYEPLPAEPDTGQR